MILIVEDDERLARLLSVTFKKMDWPSLLAQNGVDAYRLVRQKGLQCLLLDMRMPMLNGMEFLSIMKTEGINVPTIIMTGDSAFEVDKLETFPHVIGFIEKPFAVPEIVEMIQPHIASASDAASQRLRAARAAGAPPLSGQGRPFRRTWGA